jgi:hypothetical protein
MMFFNKKRITSLLNSVSWLTGKIDTVFMRMHDIEEFQKVTHENQKGIIEVLKGNKKDRIELKDIIEKQIDVIEELSKRQDTLCKCFEVLRDKTQSVCALVGDLQNAPKNCLRDRVKKIEAVTDLSGSDVSPIDLEILTTKGRIELSPIEPPTKKESPDWLDPDLTFMELSDEEMNEIFSNIKVKTVKAKGKLDLDGNWTEAQLTHFRRNWNKLQLDPLDPSKDHNLEPKSIPVSLTNDINVKGENNG